MRFSIITPSHRNSEWLRLCVASVADQGVDLEHIVQDAQSDDGTLDWLLQDRRVRAFVEPDRGMYDAINRGLRRATGDILAYLNCDEQYLPGALAAVGEFFSRHPEVEVLFADFVVVEARGEYLFHRKVQVPLQHHLWVSHLPAFSCGMFFRRQLIHEAGLYFDANLRIVGDGDWVLRLLKRDTRMAVLRRFTSVFTLRETNLGLGGQAREEARALNATAPAWARALKPLLILQHRLRRLASGLYLQRPFAFELYTLQSSGQRVRREVPSPRSRWRTHP
ncbi:MAG: glycosyltransferase [Verrucomicrobia bacterium]|nr:glycosyltransferase [Verrucomicrobiota bacterium]